MFRRLTNSWELFKASAAVLRADKELIIFPIISAIGVLIVLATFAVPMLLGGLFEAMFSEEYGAARLVGYGLTFAFYLVLNFVIIFANSALVGAAMIRLKGGDPTVSDGFRIAFQHIGSILGYALISATVGVILRWLARRGIVGRIVASLIGLGWNLATFLAVPILVVEGIGPIEAVKRSARMLKDTWGEQIAGNIGISLVFVPLTILMIIIGSFVTIFVASATSSFVVIGLTALFFVSIVIALGLVSSALTGIYTAAVYQYAVDGEVGSYFSEELVSSAFKQK